MDVSWLTISRDYILELNRAIEIGRNCVNDPNGRERIKLRAAAWSIVEPIPEYVPKFGG